MKTYKINEVTFKEETFTNIQRVDADHMSTFIPLSEFNSDYQQFKIDIAKGAQLSDANNNVMTSEQANTFLATLP